MLKAPAPPKIGDRIECAIWLTGTESPLHLSRWMETDCPAALRGMVAESEHDMALGPVQYATKKPGEDRVPPVPDWVQGPDVRLLVAEADVTAVLMKPRGTGFIDTLDRYDIARMREVTRRQFERLYGATLTDAQCDKVIEETGPDTAARTLATPHAGAVN